MPVTLAERLALAIGAAARPVLPRAMASAAPERVRHMGVEPCRVIPSGMLCILRNARDPSRDNKCARKHGLDLWPFSHVAAPVPTHDGLGALERMLQRELVEPAHVQPAGLS